MRTVLRYPGSKWNIATQLVEMIPKHYAYVEPFSREEYDQQFELPKGAICTDSFQRAAGFLIRCWQGHGFRTNGYKVGWKNDVQGRERMYALWNWYRLPEWIVDVAERLRTVQIENRPALEVIKRFSYENVFMYLDPPYLLGTRTGKQYKHEMTDADHEELLKAAVASKAKIMISGYPHAKRSSPYLVKGYRCEGGAVAGYYR